jgi:hypothetical protein
MTELLAMKSDTLAGELLVGAPTIGRFLYGDDPAAPRKVYYVAAEMKGKPRPPIFRVGSTLHARKSALLDWIEQQEKAATNAA